MYHTIVFKAANENEAKKQVAKLLKPQNIQTRQIKNFSPVNDKEPEYDPEIEQYKIIILLTADQVTEMAEIGSRPGAKKK